MATTNGMATFFHCTSLSCFLFSPPHPSKCFDIFGSLFWKVILEAYAAYHTEGTFILPYSPYHYPAAVGHEVSRPPGSRKSDHGAANFSSPLSPPLLRGTENMTGSWCLHCAHSSHTDLQLILKTAFLTPWVQSPLLGLSSDSQHSCHGPIARMLCLILFLLIPSHSLWPYLPWFLLLTWTKNKKAERKYSRSG